MLSFESDYIMGAHPQLLKRLSETNMQPQPGYGNDEYCMSAAEKIRKACGLNKADIYFISGGIQTNQLVIDSMLRSYEGVLAAETGHVNGHEAGAIEYSGHKVLTLPQYEGKVRAEDVDRYINDFFSDENHSHMVFPGMVYISHPTEYGTIYSLSELEKLSHVCRKHHIPLFLDGARLGYALAAEESDLTLEDIARLCDVFYIGGTKVGALCGEALIFTQNKPKNFITMIKQHGALLAKGRLLEVQFDTLFTDNLYFKISENAIEKAQKLKNIFENHGISFHIKSPTNQQFIILDNEFMKRLAEKVRFSFWEKKDEKSTVVRFATSWATTDKELQQLEAILNDMK